MFMSFSYKPYFEHNIQFATKQNVIYLPSSLSQLKEQSIQNYIVQNKTKIMLQSRKRGKTHLTLATQDKWPVHCRLTD